LNDDFEKNLSKYKAIHDELENEKNDKNMKKND
jgi:hypothetical protein